MGLKLFIDSSALISGVLSSDDGPPMRGIVALGEMSVLDLRISNEVQGDAEYIVRKRAPASLHIVAELIVKGNVATIPDPNDDTVKRCSVLTGYLPDARILAAAIECAADVLVTFDGEHLLGNASIRPPDASILVMTPKDCLEWCANEWLKTRQVK